MTKFNEMIETMKAVDYSEKKQFLQYLVQVAERAKHQFTQADKDALLAYAYEEVEDMLKQIPAAVSYKEKDAIFECENYLLGLVMALCGAPTQLPPEKLQKIQTLVEMVNEERRIETTIDSIFEQTAIQEADINRLLYWVRQTTDEYQKSKLFLGLAHYQRDFGKLS